MKPKYFVPILSASALLVGAPLALAQTGQGGDNTSGRTGSASEAVENRKEPALKPDAPMKDGITVYKDRVVLIKDGRMSVVTEKMEVADGLIVDKASVTKNGQKVLLTEGQIMTFDGNLIEAPKDIQDRAAATGQGAVTEKP